MSKYSLTFRLSVWRQYAFLLPVTIWIFVACHLSPAAYSWLEGAIGHAAIPLELGTLAMISLGSILLFFALPSTTRPEHISATVIDCWWYPKDLEAERLCISAKSRVAFWGVFLVLKDNQGNQTMQWILKPECDPLVYRRLVRTVLYCQNRTDLR